jgi:hypothetical protein
MGFWNVEFYCGGFSVFQNTTSWTRLYMITVRRLLEHRLLEYRIRMWWNYYIPEHHILDPLAQDTSNDASGI